MSEASIQVIVERLDNIIREMRDGFAAVHARQDKTNGRISNGEETLENHEKEDIRAIGELDKKILFTNIASGAIFLALVGNLVVGILNK